jgi:hypothetical protein
MPRTPICWAVIVGAMVEAETIGLLELDLWRRSVVVVCCCSEVMLTGSAFGSVG